MGPFTCTVCELKFCLDHSNPTAHDCQGDDITVVVCPLCDQSLKAAPGVDVNVLWMDHSASSCPGKKPDRRKCPSCQITLTLANTFHCTRCETGSDRRSGKLSRIVIALANLCHFRRRRPGFSQFSDLGVGYNEMREVRPFGRV